MGVFSRCSRADNSVVGGPIWPKFELIRDIMHVLVTYKFKMDLINSDREKVATSIFLDAQGQLTPKSVVGSGRNSNSFKHLCMFLLPASMERIGSKTA